MTPVTAPVTIPTLNHPICLSAHPVDTTTQPPQAVTMSDVLDKTDSAEEHKMEGRGQSRRGPWSPEEDRRLIDIISMYGPTNWVRISFLLGSRSAKQCRERYHQNLKPLLNRNPITFEEGLLIEQLVAKHGKKWAEIARHLRGRLDNLIKNWWNGGANRRRRALQVVPLPTGGLPSPMQPQGLFYVLSPEARLRQNSVHAPNSGHPAPAPLPGALPGAIPPALPAQILQYPKVPLFPQISFNTSMFGPMDATGAVPPPFAKPTRLVSVDLTPHWHELKLRFGEERRHSVNPGPLAAAPISSTLPLLYQHSNALASLHLSGSDHYESVSSLASRNNSVSIDYGAHPFLLTPTTPSTQHTLRRPSVAPDLFPNPLSAIDDKHRATPSRLLVSSGSGHDAKAIPPFLNLLKSIHAQEEHKEATERMRVSSLID